ncbi:hypothetical protein HAX54_026971 [Datura stramonium]|uniref:Uncharacterized protein n=1 Tax=Datura stramonium TaxID=4076 RepID=A0ABS8V1U1_DATST|nr:hypothetical protein [Datura stramonium]
MSDATVNQFLSHKDPLERAFIYGEELISNAEIKECLNILDTTYAYIKGDTTFDKLDRPSAWEKSKPSIEKSLILDLKPLPSHLCYEYLANNNTLHVELLGNCYKETAGNRLARHGGAPKRMKGLRAQTAMGYI